MSNIRAVLFDFGGVLYHAPDPQRWIRFLRLLGMDGIGSNMLASPLESQMVRDIFTGRIPEQAFWDGFARRSRVHAWAFQKLRATGFSARRFNQELATFLSSLRPTVLTAILTNAGSEFRTTFARSYALEGLVDHLIVSAEVGLCKPFEEIYHHAAEKLGVLPAEMVFVDDLPENIESARSLGIQAILFQNNVQVINEINALIQ